MMPMLDKVLSAVLAALVLGYFVYAAYVFWNLRHQTKKWDAEAKELNDKMREAKWRP